MIELEFKYVKSPAIRTGLHVLGKAISNKLEDILIVLASVGIIAAILGVIALICFNDAKHFKHHIESESGQYALFRKNKQLTPYAYDTLILKFQPNAGEYLEYVLAKSSGKYGRLNHKGQLLDSCKYDQIYNFHNGWAVTKTDNLYGYIKDCGFIKGKKSRRIKDVEPQYKYAHNFQGGFARIRYQDNTYGWLDKSGKEVPWGHVKQGGHYSNGLAWISIDKEGKSFGYVNRKGKVTNLHATSCWEFNKKRAFISKGAGYAMIDTNLNLVTDYELYPPDKNSGFLHKWFFGWHVIYEGVDCYVNKRGKITPIKNK